MRRFRWVVLAMTAGLIAIAAPAAALDTERTGQPDVVIDDVRINVPHQEPVSAWVVRPGGPRRAHSQAGVLFLHWLGQINSDRGEYLAEAVSLAGRGVVSVLPQGVFPWTVDPVGDARDITAVQRQTNAFRAALDLLTHRREVDPQRIALVGHDYGAMFGALIVDADPRIRTAVYAAPDATWGNWFVKYWLGYEGPQAEAYLKQFAQLDPVKHVSGIGDGLMFQFAGKDIFVDEATRDAFTTAAPQARVRLYPNAEHQLGTLARNDREAFLTERLHLPED